MELPSESLGKMKYANAKDILNSNYSQELIYALENLMLKTSWDAFDLANRRLFSDGMLYIRLLPVNHSARPVT